MTENTETNSPMQETMDAITNRLADYNIQLQISSDEAGVMLIYLWFIWKNKDKIDMPDEDLTHLISLIQKLSTMIAELTANDPADKPSPNRQLVAAILFGLQQELATAGIPTATSEEIY